MGARYRVRGKHAPENGEAPGWRLAYRSVVSVRSMGRAWLPQKALNEVTLASQRVSTQWEGVCARMPLTARDTPREAVASFATAKKYEKSEAIRRRPAEWAATWALAEQRGTLHGDDRDPRGVYGPCGQWPAAFRVR